MKTWQLLLILIPLSYLVGSINFASVIAKFKNRNIKELGSGNPGTMNMIRSVGKFWGCATFVLDFFKGVAVALIAKFVLKENIPFAIALLSFIVVFGHIFSVFLKFKGGKGVATCFGVFGVINPFLMMGAFVVLLVYLKLFKTGFLGSLIAVGCMTITSFFMELFYTPQGVMDGIIMCSADKNTFTYITAVIYLMLFALILFTHRSNIKRLINKEELSLSLFGKEEENNSPTDSSDADLNQPARQSEDSEIIDE